MALLLGIDTGGTYTDAVLYDEEREGERVVATAKALTTRENLAHGIGEAVGWALAAAPDSKKIALVSVSTTLATNALVEGQGRRVCLVFIGFDEADLGRAGLRQALGTDPVILAAGGYRATGEARAELDLEGIGAEVERVAPEVEAFAVVAIFGGRNPAHEIAVRDLIRERTGLPVTCGHELSNALHGPRNAVTTVLNARLIGMISDLIVATEATLAEHGIVAPLMLVRGDGSLVSADFAKLRPIETILSGPAASLVGASELTGIEDAIISDIGGTTTDIAVLRGGGPSLNAEGASVGGHRTMVEAVEMVTHGLGGDSEVRVDETTLVGRLSLGPRRLIPVSLLAKDHRPLVQETLERQARAVNPGDHDGRFLIPVEGHSTAGLGKVEQQLLDDVGNAPVAVDRVLSGRAQASAMTRLVSLGFLRLSGFTPSDAAHVTGLYGAWDGEVARMAADLFARRRDRRGKEIALDGNTLAEGVIAALKRRSAEVLLEAALAQDGFAGIESQKNALIAAALDRQGGAARIDIGVALPVIGLGASAESYYPDIAALLGAECIVPRHAEVANAVGAVAGRIQIERTLVITAPQPGAYRVHTAESPGDFTELDAAKAFALEALRDQVIGEAQAAGAADIETRIDYEEKAPDIGGQILFVEGLMTARAMGRPRIA